MKYLPIEIFPLNQTGMIISKPAQSGKKQSRESDLVHVIREKGCSEATERQLTTMYISYYFDHRVMKLHAVTFLSLNN